MLSTNVPKMFHDKHVISKMKAGGSPLHVMTREQVQKMFQARDEIFGGVAQGAAYEEVTRLETGGPAWHKAARCGAGQTLMAGARRAEYRYAL